MWVDLRKDDKESVIRRINNLPSGPKVVFINPIIGYGLVAERDYKVGEFVTFYGGVETNDEDGDYVVIVDEDYAVDSEFVFDIRDRGRWVNEKFENGEFYENVSLRYGKHDEKWKENEVFFYTIKPVKEGEEFYWWYGEEYQRPWLEETKCAVCFQPTQLQCEQTKVPYCSVKCQSFNFKK
jgi:hypothetical protein